MKCAGGWERRGEGRDEGERAGKEQGYGGGRGDQSKHSLAPGSLGEGSEE